jgi:hypothetical protein
LTARDDEQDDEQARREHAERLRRAIEEAAKGRGRPRSPREFTDQKAREAAEERRGGSEGDS